MTAWLSALKGIWRRWLDHGLTPDAQGSSPQAKQLFATATALLHTAILLGLKTSQLAKTHQWDEITPVWEDALAVLAAQATHLREQHGAEAVDQIWQQCLQLESWFHHAQSNPGMRQIEQHLDTLMAHLFDALLQQDARHLGDLHQKLKVVEKMMDTVLREVILPKLLEPIVFKKQEPM